LIERKARIVSALNLSTIRRAKTKTTTNEKVRVHPASPVQLVAVHRNPGLPGSGAMTER
jgi:hypothetical protein